MMELEEGNLPELRNPEYERGHRDGYAQGTVHAGIAFRGKLERAQRAAEETRKAAFELHRDAENVFLAASATFDALLDLTADTEAQKAEQRRTTAELSEEYSRSG